MSKKVLRHIKNLKRPKSELLSEQEKVQRNAHTRSPPTQDNKIMHTFGDVSASVPAFLAKLWRLVDDPETNNLICWTKDGSSFIIQNQAQFARELLPLNYKHNNMASFIRQLNMYGFHKITSIENGGLKFDRDEMEFSHPCFKRNCAYLLEHIKRKISATKNVDEKSAVKQEAVSKVLQDVKAMRGRQDSLDSRFSVMKQENEALWREIASLRQKHAKQQQIVNKLIQFLITIVQPSRNMSGVKRHMQLMIHDKPADGKNRKISESESEGGGPVIHELGEELLDEVADTVDSLMNPKSPYDQSNAGGMYDNECISPQAFERPQSSFSVGSQNYDYSNHSAEDLLTNVSSRASPPLSTASEANTGSNGPISAQQLNVPSSASPVQISYHVTEVPDAQPTSETTQNIYGDETNVLTTPLVREQEQRSRLLKERSKLRQMVFGSEGQKIKRACMSPKLQNQQKLPQPIQVKTEPEVDPMLYLNTYAGDAGFLNATDSSLISPDSQESGEESHHSTGNLNVGDIVSTDIINPVNADLYNANFISNDMPTELFEETSLLNDVATTDSADGYKGRIAKYNENCNISTRSIVSDSPVTSAAKMLDNGSFGASTSAAAAAAVASAPDANVASTSRAAAAAGTKNMPSSQPQGKNIDNMTVAKYTGNNGECLRTEVNDHLDNVQDELDSLKDLLRTENLSIDQNMLLGLFNDSDIIDSYGLSFLNDNTADKKGSELMTYQPMYDLSDMINDNKDADPDGINTSDQITRQLQTQNSVLNTPHHE